MMYEDGRVTILEGQFRRLAELFALSSGAVEVKQYGSVLALNNGSTKLTVNADGDDIHPSNQEPPVVKKTITYVDPFTEKPMVEDHYFHISKADLVEMEVEEHNAKYTKDGKDYTGMQAHLLRIVDSEDGRAVMKEFKAILRRAYGKKVGDRFVKGPDIWAEFEGSEAYSELVFELLTHGDELAKFVNSIMPGNLEQIAAEVAARGEAEEAGQSGATPVEGEDGGPQHDPTGLTNPVTPQVLTQAQIREMDSYELKNGLAEGRYKLS